jgi:hypothetical protein
MISRTVVDAEGKAEGAERERERERRRTREKEGKGGSRKEEGLLAGGEARRARMCKDKTGHANVRADRAAGSAQT